MSKLVELLSRLRQLEKEGSKLNILTYILQSKVRPFDKLLFRFLVHLALLRKPLTLKAINM